MLFDSGIEVGVALAKHPSIKAIAFTGSGAGGQALMKLAAARREPIPCYAEMGSTNPVFVLPGAMRERTAQLAKTLQTSFTLGSGQFCTKPGLLFIPNHGTAEFIDMLSTGIRGLQAQQMLTHGIAARYKESVRQRIANGQAKLIAGTEVDIVDVCAATAATIFSVSLEKFFDHPELAEEVFGPTTLLVHYGVVGGSVDVTRAGGSRLRNIGIRGVLCRQLGREGDQRERQCKRNCKIASRLHAFPICLAQAPE